MKPQTRKNPIGYCKLACLAALWATTATAGERLQGDALHDLHADKTFDMTHWKKGHGFVYFGPDGSMELVRDDGDRWTGKWWLKDSGDQRCIQKESSDRVSCAYVETNPAGGYRLIHPEKNKITVEIHTVLDGRQLPAPKPKAASTEDAW